MVIVGLRSRNDHSCRRCRSRQTDALNLFFCSSRPSPPSPPLDIPFAPLRTYRSLPPCFRLQIHIQMPTSKQANAKDREASQHYRPYPCRESAYSTAPPTGFRPNNTTASTKVPFSVDTGTHGIAPDSDGYAYLPNPSDSFTSLKIWVGTEHRLYWNPHNGLHTPMLYVARHTWQFKEETGQASLIACPSSCRQCSGFKVGTTSG